MRPLVVLKPVVAIAGVRARVVEAWESRAGVLGEPGHTRLRGDEVEIVRGCSGEVSVVRRGVVIEVGSLMRPAASSTRWPCGSSGPGDRTWRRFPECAAGGWRGINGHADQVERRVESEERLGAASRSANRHGTDRCAWMTPPLKARRSLSGQNAVDRSERVEAALHTAGVKRSIHGQPKEIDRERLGQRLL